MAMMQKLPRDVVEKVSEMLLENRSKTDSKKNMAFRLTSIDVLMVVADHDIPVHLLKHAPLLLFIREITKVIRYRCYKTGEELDVVIKDVVEATIREEIADNCDTSVQDATATAPKVSLTGIPGQGQMRPNGVRKAMQTGE
jgi:hypothetical protein